MQKVALSSQNTVVACVLNKNKDDSEEIQDSNFFSCRTFRAVKSCQRQKIPMLFSNFLLRCKRQVVEFLMMLFLEIF